MCKEQLKTFFSKIVPYILIILLTIIINNFIVETSGNTTFVNNFNFGSTLISITLSLIAIFYTFIDSAESKGIQDKIIQSSDSIQNTSKDLQEITNTIDSSIEKFNEMLKDVEKNIIENNKDVHQDVIQILNNINVVGKKDSNSDDNIGDDGDYIDFQEAVPKFSGYNKLILYIINESYKKQKNINMTDFNFETEKLYISWAIISFVNILTTLNLMKISVTKNCITITYIDEKFSKLIEETASKTNFKKVGLNSEIVEKLKNLYND